MKLEGQYGWFMGPERAGLEILKNHYSRLIEHVTNQRKKYEKYIKASEESARKLGMKEIPRRQVLAIATIYIRYGETDIMDLIYDYELKGKPQTLTEALSLFDLFVDGWGLIDRTETKVLFLLLAGLEAREI